MQWEQLVSLCCQTLLAAVQAQHIHNHHPVQSNLTSRAAFSQTKLRQNQSLTSSRAHFPQPIPDAVTVLGVWGL